MTPEEEKLHAEIALLHAIHFDGMDDKARQNLTDSINDIEEEYRNARAIADDKTRSEGERKYAEDLGNAIAKGVPEMLRGALSAVTAFKNGDNMAGSAAIMDLCAAAAPIFAAVLGAAGPEGALVGALFSVVGQLLAFFGPQQPPLTAQIKKMLETLEAEKELADLAGVHSAINIYTDALDNTRKRINKILTTPLTDASADQIRTHLESLKLGVIDQQGQLNGAAFEQWKVGGWLKTKENHQKDRWPEVLGAWCRTYTDLMTANMRVHCLANPARVAELLSKTAKANKASPITDPTTRDEVHTAVINDLGAILEFLRDKFSAWNAEALRVLNATSQAVRDRALYVHIGQDEKFYAATQVLPSDLLRWEYKNNTEWLKSFSIVVPKNVDSLATPYDVFALQNYGRNINRHKLDPNDGSLGNGAGVLRPRDGELFADMYSLADPDDPTSRVYTAHNGGEGGRGAYQYLNVYKVDVKGNSERINWEPHTRAGFVHIRAVFHPPAVLPDDPDGVAMADGTAPLPGPPLLTQKQDIIYGGFLDFQDIWVTALNQWGYVPSPWGKYNGIEVDPYYLWVFGAQRFACATHASVIRCRQGKIPKPNWIEYAFEDATMDIRSLAPSIDGTLTAASQAGMWTAEYNINLKDRNINIRGNWSERRGVALRVEKIPIPCWCLYDSLKQDLALDSKAMVRSA